MTLLDAVLGRLSLHITCIINSQSISLQVTHLTLELSYDVPPARNLQQKARYAYANPHVRSV